MFPFGRFMKVHSFDVGSLDSASHRATGAGVDGTNAPCFSVVLHEMRAGESGFLRNDENICCGIFSPCQGQFHPNHIGTKGRDSCDVGDVRVVSEEQSVPLWAVHEGTFV